MKIMCFLFQVLEFYYLWRAVTTLHSTLSIVKTDSGVNSWRKELRKMLVTHLAAPGGQRHSVHNN
jgi:hypothetical protein